MYLLYSEYQSMGGVLNEATFNDMEREARHIVDYYTYGRLKRDTSVSADVKECMYSIIKLVAANSSSLGVVTDENGNLTGASKDVSSYSNDGVSISYNQISAADAFDKRKDEIQKCIQYSLAYAVNEAGRKLLYKGVYPDE